MNLDEAVDGMTFKDAEFGLETVGVDDDDRSLSDALMDSTSELGAADDGLEKPGDSGRDCDGERPGKPAVRDFNDCIARSRLLLSNRFRSVRMLRRLRW